MDPLSIAFGGIGALGSLFKGITGLFAGNAAKKAAEYNAIQEEGQASINANTQLIQGERAVASGAARAAANGGGLGGSTQGVLEDLSNQAMFNARTAVYRGQTEARATLYQGALAATQGRDQFASGIVGAGSSLLGGFMRSNLLTQYQQAENYGT